MADAATYTKEVIQAKQYAAYLRGLAASNKSIPNSTYNGAFDGRQFMRAIDYMATGVDFFDIGTAKTILKAMTECPQVSTILFRKGQAHANGITTLTQTNGNPLRGPKADMWQRVFDRPNIFQNRAQYVVMRNIFLGSSGWCAEYKEIPLGMGPENMQRRLLNPLQCEIVWKQRTLFGVTDRAELIDKFYYTENGIRREIKDFENLYFYTNPNVFGINKGYLPESPLKSLKYPINNSIINYKSRNRLIKKPFGALSGKNKDDVSMIPLNPDEIKEIQNSYRNNYGTEFDDQDDLIITSSDVSFVPFMYPIKDLQLLELLKSDSAVICDVMGYEYDLLARDLGGVALNNKNEAGKNLYQNHIIPEAKNQDEQEMESLNASMNGFIISTDFSHLPVMQEDKKLSSEALRNNVQALVVAFKNNQCSYDDMVSRIGVSQPNAQWKGKWWYEFLPEEKAQFDNSHNLNNGNNNGNQGSNQGQGNNNQN